MGLRISGARRRAFFEGPPSSRLLSGRWARAYCIHTSMSHTDISQTKILRVEFPGRLPVCWSMHTVICQTDISQTICAEPVLTHAGTRDTGRLNEAQKCPSGEVPLATKTLRSPRPKVASALTRWTLPADFRSALDDGRVGRVYPLARDALQPHRGRGHGGQRGHGGGPRVGRAQAGARRIRAGAGLDGNAVVVL